MYFNGAEEFYFWEGLKLGINKKTTYTLVKHPYYYPLLNTNIDILCCESFKNGYILGMNLDKNEYKNLFLKEKTKEEIDEFNNIKRTEKIVWN